MSPKAQEPQHVVSTCIVRVFHSPYFFGSPASPPSFIKKIARKSDFPATASPFVPSLKEGEAYVPPTVTIHMSPQTIIWSPTNCKSLRKV